MLENSKVYNNKENVESKKKQFKKQIKYSWIFYKPFHSLFSAH